MKFCVVFSLFLSVLTSNAQIISTVAGNGNSGYNGDNVLAINATIGFMGGVEWSSNGELFIADGNNRIRKVSANGIITTVAGNGQIGYNGDSILAINAQLNSPVFIAVDSSGDIFISDKDNNRIRRVDVSTGIITTYAGNGIAGYNGDGGLAANAELNAPYGICFDSEYNLYIGDHLNSRIRKVNRVTGIITTFAGNGTGGYIGDGGIATSASILSGFGMCVDQNDNLYFADGAVLRSVNSSTNIISTIAGTGVHSFGGDGGLASLASLSGPIDVDIDSHGNIYICEIGNYRVRRITPDGIINSVVGNGNGGYNGDSIPAINATISSPRGLTLDSCDNLYISDNGNRRIRKVEFNPNCWPLNVNAAAPLSFAIYPNPADEQLTVTGANLQQISITNMQGQVVHRQQANEERTVVDISAFRAGMYFITVTDKQGATLTKKIVKE